MGTLDLTNECRFLFVRSFILAKDYSFVVYKVTETAMLRWFKKDTYPELDTIRESPIRDKYFYRVAHYHWMDDQQEQIVVQHPAETKMITCERWN